MTINKAIEILAEAAFARAITHDKNFIDALKLAMDALKFYAELKRTQGIEIAFLLPGEILVKCPPQPHTDEQTQGAIQSPVGK